MRSLTSGQATTLASGVLECCWFVELQFDSATLRVTTAGHTMDWGGYSWLGSGLLLSVDPVVEASTLEATGTKVSLSGVPTSMLALALAEPTQGRTAIIRSVFRSVETGQIVDTPPVEMQGIIDVPQIDISPDGTFTVAITIESDLADFSRPNVRRYTDADHQARYPGDRALERVGSVVLQTLVWPSAQAQR